MRRMAEPCTTFWPRVSVGSGPASETTRAASDHKPGLTLDRRKDITLALTLHPDVYRTSSIWWSSVAGLLSPLRGVAGDSLIDQLLGGAA